MTDFSPDVKLPSFTKQMVTLLLRHGLTAISGALVAHGLLPQDQTAAFEQVGLGLAGVAVSAAWAIWQKHVARTRLASAIAAPSATPVK